MTERFERHTISQKGIFELHDPKFADYLSLRMSVVRIDSDKCRSHGWQARWGTARKGKTAFYSDFRYGGRKNALNAAQAAEAEHHDELPSPPYKHYPVGIVDYVTRVDSKRTHGWKVQRKNFKPGIDLQQYFGDYTYGSSEAAYKAAIEFARWVYGNCKSRKRNLFGRHLTHPTVSPSSISRTT